MLTKAEIEKYFTAEKSESLLFLVIGIIAILLAIAFFFFLKTSFYKGAAVPLLVIGIIQAIVGFTVYSQERWGQDQECLFLRHGSRPD